MKRGRHEYRGNEILPRVRMAAVAFAVHALSYLLMPAASELAESRHSFVPRLLVGCIFWLSVAAGYAFVLWADAGRKRLAGQCPDAEDPRQRHVGAVTFFSNTPAAVVDAALLAGIAALAAVCCIGAADHTVTYVLLTVVSFSLHMHGLLNGRIYRITKYKQTRGVENHE